MGVASSRSATVKSSSNASKTSRQWGFASNQCAIKLFFLLRIAERKRELYLNACGKSGIFLNKFDPHILHARKHWCAACNAFLDDSRISCAPSRPFREFPACSTGLDVALTRCSGYAVAPLTVALSFVLT